MITREYLNSFENHHGYQLKIDEIEEILINQKLRELVEKQIKFQREINPQDYNSSSLLHIFQSLLDEAKK